MTATAALALHVMIGIAPVLCFLAALVVFDSYKLVSTRAIITAVAFGLLAAIACYGVNGAILSATGLDVQAYARYVGPLVEELAKGLVIVALIRASRVGFLVDAAIVGFAVGAGFAIVENVWYQFLVPDAGIGIWIVRGFGTAIMHGGVTAIFALMGLAVIERGAREAGLVAFAPGFVLAVLLHAAFNQMLGSPRLATLAVLIVLPPLLFLVFRRSELAVARWLGQGFDADAHLLDSIASGGFADSPTGTYLKSLKKRFAGPVVADLLCYVRLHTELGLRAKGLLMMRQNGFDVPVDGETRAKFDEIRYLERSVGKTALLAIRPMLRISRKELWQIYMLER
jgi:RsiW-degrading membrane proteinase PrsW (M82 family)